jgi:hypothetical protein
MSASSVAYIGDGWEVYELVQDEKKKGRYGPGPHTHAAMYCGTERKLLCTESDNGTRLWVIKMTRRKERPTVLSESLDDGW